MNLLDDIAYVTKNAASKTFGNIKNNWQVIFVGLAYALLAITIIFLMNFILAGPIGIFGGIIMVIVESALISSYLYVLSNVITYNRFRWKDIKYGITQYIWKVYGVIFVFYIAGLLLNLAARILGPIFYTFYWILPIVVFIVFNPLPEVIYTKERDPLETLAYCLEFMKENWLNWLIPNLVFFFLSYLTLSGLFAIIGTTWLKLSITTMFLSLLGFIASGVVISVAMLYRGNLFQMLSTSSRRKRQFMRKI